MSSNPRIRAIVFDFDGVILESADVKTVAFVQLFAAHGPDVQARVREHHLANMGISRFKKFAWIYEHVLQQSLSEEASRALGERFSAIALDQVLAAPFVEGAHEALLALAPRFPLFVASGTPQAELDLIVDSRGLRSLFREVHGTPAEKPEILRSIMQRHQCAADELLFIGDGASDHDAAVAAGVAFLARDTSPMRDYWSGLGVRRGNDLTDLPAVVERW